jgi:DNA mismatch endonuclease (patch repair protein)
MVDTWTITKRSQVMSLVRNKGNKSTEICFAALLRDAGVKGWRRHLKLPGKPDFAFPKLKVAIFVDGDFWHGNPATYRPPKSNMDFWTKKILYNRENDRRVNALLGKLGWKVIRVWESDLQRGPLTVLLRLLKHLPMHAAKALPASHKRKRPAGR